MSRKPSRLFFLIIVSMAILFASTGLQAQQANAASIGRNAAPHRLITFNGSVKDANGQPRLGTIGIAFSLYASQEGGEALWPSRTLSAWTVTVLSAPCRSRRMRSRFGQTRTTTPGIRSTLHPVRNNLTGDRIQITRSPGFMVRLPD